jgi:hypothetical protein
MKNANQNGLYPIIRRVRRPLLPVELAPEAKPVAVNRSEESSATNAVQSRDEESTDADASHS